MSMESCPNCKRPMLPCVVQKGITTVFKCQAENIEYHVCYIQGDRTLVDATKFARLKREMNG